MVMHIIALGAGLAIIIVAASSMPFVLRLLCGGARGTVSYDEAQLSPNLGFRSYVRLKLLLRVVVVSLYSGLAVALTVSIPMAIILREQFFNKNTIEAMFIVPFVLGSLGPCLMLFILYVTAAVYARLIQFGKDRDENSTE